MESKKTQLQDMINSNETHTFSYHSLTSFSVTDRFLEEMYSGVLNDTS